MKPVTVYAASAIALILTACGNSSGGPFIGVPPASSAPTSAPTSGPPSSQLVSTKFIIRVPSRTTAAAVSKRREMVRGAYVGAGVQSITIALNTVNGSAPPSGLTTTVTTNITLPCSPCTVPGPSVPPGSDSFTLTTYDGLTGGGNAISTGSPTLTIVAGTSNTNTITLDGIPAAFSFSGAVHASANSAFATPAPLTLAVEDADGNAITGTYAKPVTISDSDTSSLSQGSGLIVNSGSPASSVQSTSSSDALMLSYGGLAIVPATIAASATGATSGTMTFAPTLQAIAYSGPQSGSNPEIDLYTTSGTGSSATFSASELGWTNAPYNRSLSLASSGCTNIGTVSPSTGTSFGAEVVASPSVGSCTLTLSDFTGGQTTSIVMTYTTTGFGIQ